MDQISCRVQIEIFTMTFQCKVVFDGILDISLRCQGNIIVPWAIFLDIHTLHVCRRLILAKKELSFNVLWLSC